MVHEDNIHHGRFIDDNGIRFKGRILVAPPQGLVAIWRIFEHAVNRQGRLAG